MTRNSENNKILGLHISEMQYDLQNQTRQIWGIWKLRPAYSPETPNLGQIWRFF